MSKNNQQDALLYRLLSFFKLDDKRKNYPNPVALNIKRKDLDAAVAPDVIITSNALKRFALGTTTPDHNTTQLWYDTTLSPGTLKEWNGSAWVAANVTGGETDPVWAAEKTLYLTVLDAALTYYPSSNPAGYITGAGTAAHAGTLSTPRKINGVDFDGSADIETDAYLMSIQDLGSPIVTQNVNGSLSTVLTGTVLVSGRLYFSAIRLRKAKTITGIVVKTITSGVFTGNNFCGVAAFNYATGSITRVAISANDENYFKGTANDLIYIPFTAPVALTAGLYFGAFMYSASATTTQPVFGSLGTGITVNTIIGAGTNKLAGFISGQTAIPSTMAMTSINAYGLEYWMGFY